MISDYVNSTPFLISSVSSRVTFKTRRGFHICAEANMGKVRTEMVKRISLELVNRYPKSFTIEFEQNKQFLKEINLDVSKKLRNKIAGYVTRINRVDQAIDELEKQPQVEEIPE